MDMISVGFMSTTLQGVLYLKNEATKIINSGTMILEDSKRRDGSS